MGQAIIATGIYPISNREGEAIFSFTPPKIEHIDWKKLKDHQTYEISEYAYESQIIANWLVYLRTGLVDIRKFPFTSLKFRDIRPKAELLNSLLELCMAIWENEDIIRLYYQSPANWWADCIVEEQNAALDAIVFGGDEFYLTKGAIEDGIRALRSALKMGNIPFTKNDKNIHLYRVYECAIKLKSNKIIKPRKNYLDKLGEYAKAIKNNSDIKSVVAIGKNLCYRDKKAYKAIATPRIEKETILEGRIIYTG